jgi:hypothetical protein
MRVNIQLFIAFQITMSDNLEPTTTSPATEGDTTPPSDASLDSLGISELQAALTTAMTGVPDTTETYYVGGILFKINPTNPTV